MEFCKRSEAFAQFFKNRLAERTSVRKVQQYKFFEALPYAEPITNETFLTPSEKRYARKRGVLKFVQT